jgi:hypothetical protein
MTYGITDAFDQTGESEEVYDTNTNDLHYKHSLSMQVMTEWKKFEPLLWEVLDFDMALNMAVKKSELLVTHDNRVLDLKIVPAGVPFEVKFPKTGFPRYL